MQPELYNLAAQLGVLLKEKQSMLVTAESCTGGQIAQVITSIAGSSQWFERGFVTYTNLAKQEMLGVAPEILQAHGAVSEPTARAMAEGALRYSQADISVAVTGIAGPEGGTAEKPVGTVWLAWAKRNGSCEAKCCQFTGDRAAIRMQATKVALQGILQLV